MIFNQSTKFFIYGFLFTSILKPISSGMAQGYFPDVTLSKPISISKSGKIKFREDWLYTYNEGKMTPLGVKIAYDRFDSLGLKVEEANYDIQGNPMLEVTYTYDEWGRELQCLGLKESKSFYRKWSYSFVDSTKALVKSVYNNPTNLERWVYYFDSTGNIREEVSYNSNGEFNYRYIIKYTKFNKPAELTEYSGNGAMYEKWVYLYNKQFQNIEILQFNSSEELYRKYINKFDEKGIQKEVITVDNKGTELERTLSVYQFFK